MITINTPICKCDWATGECHAPLNCQAVADAVRLRAINADLLAVLTGLMEVLEDAGFESEIMNDVRAAIAKTEAAA
jgi:hypothetical protein